MSIYTVYTSYNITFYIVCKISDNVFKKKNPVYHSFIIHRFGIRDYFINSHDDSILCYFQSIALQSMNTSYIFNVNVKINIFPNAKSQSNRNVKRTSYIISRFHTPYMSRLR